MTTMQDAPSPMSEAAHRADSILSKAFAILGAFTHGSRTLSLSQISRLSGIPKSTTHRVLAMLVNLGAVERGGTEYRMGDVMFSYGSASPPLPPRSVPLHH